MEKVLCEACKDGEHGECFHGFNWNDWQCGCGCDCGISPEIPEAATALENEFIRPESPIETRLTF